MHKHIPGEQIDKNSSLMSYLLCYINLPYLCLVSSSYELYFFFFFCFLSGTYQIVSSKEFGREFKQKIQWQLELLQLIYTLDVFIRVIIFVNPSTIHYLIHL